MSARLESAIASLASQFARDVVALIGSVQVGELVALAGARAPAARAPIAAAPSVARAAAPSAKKGAVRSRQGGRRSSAEILAELDRIVAAVAAQPGQRSEEIQKKLGIASKDIERPISIGLAKGLLRKEGEKRATRYFPGKGKGASAVKVAKPAKKVAKKAAKKVAKKAAKKAVKKAPRKVAKKGAAPAPATPAAAS